ncbi:S9 family peptidase [Oleiharenicola lentus]|uniref:S9 family peptidase n=1 Tax=Oleiharenicola lentus TaxID=2508720 RepID=UPI003F67F28D
MIYSPFLFPRVRSVFLAALVAPAFVFAEEPKPASPGEIAAGQAVASGFSLSPDGRWLLFSTSKGQGNIDLTSGKMANVKTGWSMSAATPRASWSPLDPTLALSVRREGKGALTLWPAGEKPDSEKVRELLVFPRKLYPKMPVLWSPDAKTVYLAINQNLPWPKSHPSDDNPPTRDNNVNLELAGSYKPDNERRRFEKEYEGAYAESNRSLIMALDVATGKLGLLAKGNDIDSLTLSPDGKRLAIMQVKHNSSKALSGSWAKQYLGDVYLIDVNATPVADLPVLDLEKMEDRKAGWSDHLGQRLEPVMKDVGTNDTGTFNPPFQQYGTNGNPTLVWSPDSTQILYATVGRQSTGDIYVYDVATKQTRNLTEKLSLQKPAKLLGYGENLTHVYDSQKFGFLFNPLWLADSKTLVAVGRGDVWRLSVDGTQPPKNLTAKLDQEIVRIVPAPGLQTAAIDASGQLTLVGKDRLSRLDALWKLDPHSGTAMRFAQTGVWTDLTIATDVRGESLVYSGQAATSSKNLQRITLKPGATPEFVTKFKLGLAERVYPQSRLLSWKTPDGYLGFGLLYLPAGASATNQVPLIFNGYPSEDDSRVDVRAKNGAGFYNDSLHGLLAEGFAVLFADIPMSDTGVYEKPTQQIVAGVNAAIDAVVATGLIDEKRMGIMGTSYGSIMVNAVVTQTNRFKAAASISGLSNWVADYMGGGDVSGLYHEYGQGRFVKQLWQDPQRYVEASPIMSFDKIETPLLLVHGDGDYRVPVRHAWETFKALNHLKKNVIFARYPRMGHGANAEASRRIQGWFREHLLGGKAITHLADQGSFMFGASEGTDDASSPDNPAPTPTPPGVPPPPPNTPPVPTETQPKSS